MLITSCDNSRIKEAKKLLDKKHSNSEELFIIEGENLVVEAFKNGLLKELFVLEGNKTPVDTEFSFVTEKVMRSMSDLSSTPRVLGISKYKKVSDLGNRIVLLDDVQDPGNMGTVIRNACAFDIDTIVCSRKCANIYSNKVLRSTGGQIFNVNIVIDDIEKVIDEIKKKNTIVIGTSLKKSMSLEEVKPCERYAIVFGNEGNGVREEVLNKCDKIVRIDMNSKCESLNVGVSNGIILYHMYKGEKE